MSESCLVNTTNDAQVNWKKLLIITIVPLLLNSCKLQNADGFSLNSSGPADDLIDAYVGINKWIRTDLNVGGESRIYAIDLVQDDQNRFHIAVIISKYDIVLRQKYWELIYFTDRNHIWEKQILKKSTSRFSRPWQEGAKNSYFSINLMRNDVLVHYVSDNFKLIELKYNDLRITESILDEDVVSFNYIIDPTTKTSHLALINLKNSYATAFKYKAFNEKLELVEKREINFLDSQKYTPHIEQLIYEGKSIILLNGYSEKVQREKLFLLKDYEVYTLGYLGTNGRVNNINFNPDNQNLRTCYIGPDYQRYELEVNLASMITQYKKVPFKHNYTFGLNCAIGPDHKFPFLSYDLNSYANFVSFNWFKKEEGSHELEMDEISLVKTLGRHLFIAGISKKEDSVILFQRAP